MPDGAPNGLPNARPTGRARWRGWAAGLLALALATAALLAVRARLDKVHVALVYLLVVLGGSAAGGRALGVVLAGAAFVAFNVLFLAPYGTLVVADPRDWLVLFAFLATGVVAAQLLYRAQAEAAVARRRAAEVDRLAALGAVTLSAGRADDALAAIARVIRTTLGVGACGIYTWDGGASGPKLAAADRDSGEAPDVPAGPGAPEWGGAPALVRWVAEHGRAARELADGTARLTPDSAASPGEASRPGTAQDGTVVRALLIPLAVRGRTVGVLRVADGRAVALDPTRERYLDALAHYAALGVERVRLTAEAEHAAALREADRLKDSLLATVSHDLRTPLTTIRGLAHDLAAAGEERALVIAEEVDRLNRMVADLLDLSRLTAGGVALAVALNAAEDVMGAALQRVGGLAAGREIRAALDPTEPVLVGRFDFAHALRVLVNLLENALKYAPAGAPVDFTVRRDTGPGGDVLAFAVADRGPGVPTGERDRIFAPFYRPPNAPPDAGGAGLGLAIARGLAEAQGGTLTYAPREGGGSVFTLRLPADDLAAAVPE